MKKEAAITSWAPGSSMILGEYAIVQSGAAIIGSLNKGVKISLKAFKPLTHASVGIEGPLGKDTWQIGQVKQTPYSFIKETLELFYQLYPHLSKKSFHLYTQTEFDISWGLGSSAASVAALLTALDHLYQLKLSLKEKFFLGLKAIRKVQGKASGADLLASLYGGINYCSFAGKENFYTKNIKLPKEWVSTHFHWVYMGYKTSTKQMLKEILKDKSPNKALEMMNSATEQALESIETLNENEWIESLKKAQQALEVMGCVDTKMREVMTFFYKKGFEVKVSGSGWGDCLLIYTNTNEKIEKDNSFKELFPVKILDTINWANQSAHMTRSAFHEQ